MLNFIRKRLRYSSTKVYIGDVELDAIIADSFIKRVIGLMYRDSIKENECMLFTFPHESMLGIWMKGMKFPIDILWLDSSKEIVTIKENIQPCNKLPCHTYYPERKSMYVIELHSGFVKKNSIDKFTRIRFAER